MATCCALCNHGVLTLLNDSLSAPLSVVGGLRSIVVYLDSDFDPNRQIFHPLLNVFASASTHLYVACSYVNNGPDAIGFGESASDEICLSALYTTPSYDESFPSGFDGISF